MNSIIQHIQLLGTEWGKNLGTGDNFFSGNHFHHFKEGSPHKKIVMETRPYQRIMVINNHLNTNTLFLGVALGDALRFSRKKGEQQLTSGQISLGQVSKFRPPTLIVATTLLWQGRTWYPQGFRITERAGHDEKLRNSFTLPETNIAPENGWLEDYVVSFWDGPFWSFLSHIFSIQTPEFKWLLCLKPWFQKMLSYTSTNPYHRIQVSSNQPLADTPLYWLVQFIRILIIAYHNPYIAGWSTDHWSGGSSATLSVSEEWLPSSAMAR